MSLEKIALRCIGCGEDMKGPDWDKFSLPEYMEEARKFCIKHDGHGFEVMGGDYILQEYKKEGKGKGKGKGDTSEDGAQLCFHCSVPVGEPHSLLCSEIGRVVAEDTV